MFKIKAVVIFLFCSGSLLAQPAARSFAVLELFTSQGCSSCPPAEKLLGKVIAEAKKSGRAIYAMEYHVDYWNKYGWKDPYSSFKYTMRQRNYVSVLQESQAYTPQLIINGEKALLGSDEKLINTAVEQALNKPGMADLDIQYLGAVNDSMVIAYQASKADKNYYLKVVLVEKETGNAVSRGENAGKKLIHHNVVSVFSSFDLNQAKGEVKVALNKKIPGKNNLIIAFVQQRQTMKILGVTATEIAP